MRGRQHQHQRVLGYGTGFENAGEHTGSGGEVRHFHRFLGIVVSVFVAHKQHRGGQAPIGKDRRAVTMQELMETLYIRRMLESDAAARSAGKIPQAKLADLRQRIAALMKADEPANT